MKIVFALALLISMPTVAQEYIVTLKGDTLKGDIQIHSYDLLDRVSVKSDGVKKKVFTALEVRSVFLDSAVHTAVQYENAIRLMRQIKVGYLSLYAFKIGNQNTFDGRLLVKMNGSRLEVPNIQFKKMLANYLGDCPATSEKISSGEFSRTEVGDLVDDYNNCIKEKNGSKAAALNDSPASKAIEDLRTKVESSSLDGRKDIVDLLNTMNSKVRANEPVPGFLRDGLKSYLGDKKEFEEDLNKLLELIQ